jgi:hypothetical protein
VRGACLILADDDGVRADMTASWLAQMGWSLVARQGCIEWELELAAQLERNGTHRFRVI